MNVTVILSGGAGVRFGGTLPKQYEPLCGKEVIAYPIEAARRSTLTDTVLVPADENHLPGLRSGYGVDCCLGGKTHNGTVRNSLEYITRHYPCCEKVIFADSVRPFVTAELIDDYFRLLDDYDAVITAQHITDSLGCEGETFVDRTPYYLIQKPEAFRFGMLYNCFKPDSDTTAIVQQLPETTKVMKYFGFSQNMKITYREDLYIAECLMNLKTKGEGV
jgi:2-C-methyl-D-erythritol 4-phosphate cytidylyltransferase